MSQLPIIHVGLFFTLQNGMLSHINVLCVPHAYNMVRSVKRQFIGENNSKVRNFERSANNGIKEAVIHNTKFIIINRNYVN